METGKFFEASTAHVTHRDMELLEVSEAGAPFDSGLGTVTTYREGAFASIPEPEVLADTGEQLRRFGFSFSFTELIRKCSENDVRVLWLDADAPKHSNLPLCDWEQDT